MQWPSAFPGHVPMTFTVRTLSPFVVGMFNPFCGQKNVQGFPWISHSSGPNEGQSKM